MKVSHFFLQSVILCSSAAGCFWAIHSPTWFSNETDRLQKTATTHRHSPKPATTAQGHRAPLAQSPSRPRYDSEPIAYGSLVAGAAGNGAPRTFFIVFFFFFFFPPFCFNFCGYTVYGIIVLSILCSLDFCGLLVVLLVFLVETIEMYDRLTCSLSGRKPVHREGSQHRLRKMRLTVKQTQISTRARGVKTFYKSIEETQIW